MEDINCYLCMIQVLNHTKFVYNKDIIKIIWVIVFRYDAFSLCNSNLYAMHIRWLHIKLYANETGENDF